MERKYLLVFLLGFFSFAFLFFIFYGVFSITGLSIYNEVSSPSDWISEDDILILGDKIVLNITNATLSNYADTGSMKPFLSQNSNGIRIRPNIVDDINVGDIVSYRFFGNLLVHRVVEKGVDDKGVYFIVKGDYNFISDKKIRFEDIEYITVAIIY